VADLHHLPCGGGEHGLLQASAAFRGENVLDQGDAIMEERGLWSLDHTFVAFLQSRTHLGPAPLARIVR
jgi:hypothetical protein